ncbi:MAG: PAS domain-containing methyl-accepting chemotaxis protein [Oligoflexia bacterium]|nr:PAS domain-containing methyl-accepting chemotaxis protein [Oligoflexia bacterium]
MWEAVNANFAVIEFNPDGSIINANPKFLKVVGHDLEDIQGKHHRIFIDSTYRNSEAYKAFWTDLAAGKAQNGEFKRVTKDNNVVYLQASYAPVFDHEGNVVKVTKIAIDMTAERLKAANYEGQITAINKTQAVIEFNLDGTVIGANDNFLKVLGYSNEEIKGKHHSLFCDPSYTCSNDYKMFWEKLNRGDYDAAEYKRIGKGGKEVWIQASYNPIFDLNGKPFKVVKYATDMTKQKMKNADYQGQISAISKAQAVIEFNMDGTVINANDNFLNTIGYSLDEIKGKHHRIFCENSYTSSNEYRAFWEKLNRGEYDAAEYKRIGKGGKEVWIQASYNPIFDLNGKPFKVVKYATDLTKIKNERLVLINSLTEPINQLAAAAGELSATATQMAKNSEKTNKESTSASTAAEQVSRGVKAVATNTEEMAASIREIAKSSNEAASISKETLVRAQETNKTIGQLGASSQEIGNVIKVISSIAQQTNLLALNATIEAARAGDAGKGFAVVANEVKELAKQTAKATEDITGKVGTIQKDSQGAVDAIGEIGKVIERLNGISGTIAAAVEEQSATTTEVTKVVQDSSKGVEAITATIKVVSSAAQESLSGANQTLDAAKSLSQLAEKLKEIMKKLSA